ncbi:MAG: efflux RND transporter periplasmic adaptor subunit [Gemmataceae bacterium]
MKLVRIGGFAVLAAGFAAVVGCGGDKGAPPPPPPPVVSVAKPATAPVQHFYEYNGHLETTQMVEVRARVKGVLTKVHFKEGMEVRGQRGAGFLTIPGDLLYSIDEREYRTAVKKSEADLEKAKADIENWKAQVNLAKAELKRVEVAAESLASSQTDVDKARATLGVNTAMLASAHAQSDSAAASLHTANILLGYTRIHAKYDGRISRTLVDEGNLVGQSETTLLTTIVRMDELYVYFDVPEKDWMEWGNRLSHDLNQTIPLEVGATGEAGWPHKGRVDFRENRVDPGTGTVRIRGRIPNPMDSSKGSRSLYPGLYARIRLPAGPPKDSPVIPEDALMTGQDGRYVFVVDAENKVQRRVVVVGPTVFRMAPATEKPVPGWTLFNEKPAQPKGDLPPRPPSVPVRSMVSIEKGLSANDTVIVEGLQKTRPGGDVVPEKWELRPPPK